MKEKELGEFQKNYNSKKEIRKKKLNIYEPLNIKVVQQKKKLVQMIQNQELAIHDLKTQKYHFQNMEDSLFTMEEQLVSLKLKMQNTESQIQSAYENLEKLIQSSKQ